MYIFKLSVLALSAGLLEWTNAAAVDALARAYQPTCCSTESALKTLKACTTKTSFCKSLTHFSTKTVDKTVTSTKKVHTVTASPTACGLAVTTVPPDRRAIVEAAHAEKRAPVATTTSTATGTVCGLEAYPTSRWTQVCSCLSINKATTTQTITSAVTLSTSTVTPPCTCTTPLGYEYAIFPNNQGAHGDEYYSNFDPAFYKQTVPNPDDTGVEEIIGFSSSVAPVYNRTDFDVNNFAVIQRGYIYAQYSGTYTLAVTYVDDAVYTWINANAYSGYNRGNYNGFAVINSDIPSSTVTLTAVAGTYYPFRFVYGQGGGPYGLQLTITDPNNNVILGGTEVDSKQIVTSGGNCDAPLAPAFQPFGQET